MDAERQPLSRQDIFDRVCEHLLNQGVPCMDSAETCVYELNGLRCAMGIFFGDDEGALANGDTIDDVLERFPRIRERLQSMPLEQLSGLQYVHDARDPEDWEKYLKAFANQSGLKWTPFSEIATRLEDIPALFAEELQGATAA